MPQVSFPAGVGESMILFDIPAWAVIGGVVVYVVCMVVIGYNILSRKET